MRLKSYFAGTVEAAMALAREELGPDAMLVQSKKTTPETRHIGQYEVVFALPEPEPPAKSGSHAMIASFKQVFSTERETAIEKLSTELDALKKRIENMAGALAPGLAAAMPAPAQLESQPADSTAMQQLRKTELDAELIEMLRNEIAGSRDSTDAIREALSRRVQVDSNLGVAGASRRIVALVGPPGAGKTTTLVKLAARYGLTARRSVHLISTDVFRIGAAEQLRLYASILGVGFQTIETPLLLAQALEEHRRKDLIFIDTPGRVREDHPEIAELASFIASDPDIDVHLVLPVSNRSVDLTRIVDRYSIFRPAKLIFTRLDETGCYGPLINQCWGTGKPVSFLAGGELIPEDLEEASVSRILDLVVHGSTPEPLQTEAPHEEVK
jgi:flagellar biosynthesis protein FlhF